MRHSSGITMVLLVGLAGCMQPAVDVLMPPEPPVVWPKAPDPPRVRFLGKLTSSDDVRTGKSMSQVWNELLYGPAEPARLVNPYAVGVHADGNRVAIADTNGRCIHVFDLAERAYRRKESCGPSSEPLACPVAVAWVEDALWVADAKLHAVVVFGPSGQSRLIGRERLKRPAGLAYCRSKERCYVSDAAAHVILVFDRQGAFLFQFGGRGSDPGQFNCPSHLACGPDDTLVVADSLNFRVQRLGLDGSPLGAFGKKGDAAGDFALPKGVAVGPDGNVWVVDAHFENVQAFTPDGRLLLAVGREGHAPGEFWLPAGICFDTKRRMWIADAYNRRVQVFELLPCGPSL